MKFFSVALLYALATAVAASPLPGKTDETQALSQGKLNAHHRLNVYAN
jgi:hypothetical protein